MAAAAKVIIVTTEILWKSPAVRVHQRKSDLTTPLKMFNVSDLGICAVKLQRKAFPSIGLFLGSIWILRACKSARCTSLIGESAQITRIEQIPNSCTSIRCTRKCLWFLNEKRANHEWWRRRKRRKRGDCRGEKEKEGGILLYVQVRGNLRQPQWAIKQMGNLVMPIKSGGREGKNREMKQNVILIRTTWLPSPSSCLTSSPLSP